MISLLFAALTLVAVAVLAEHLGTPEPASRRTRGRRPPREGVSDRAGRLHVLEGIAADATVSAGAAHDRLRPQLRFLVVATLRRRGIDLDTDPRAEELLGPVVWPLLRAGGGAPPDPAAPGLTDVEVEALTAMLERIR